MELGNLHFPVFTVAFGRRDEPPRKPRQVTRRNKRPEQSRDIGAPPLPLLHTHSSVFILEYQEHTQGDKNKEGPPILR